MRLATTHTTTYSYSEPVSICHTEVHLTPRDSGDQTVFAHTLKIDPSPECSIRRLDYFDNEVVYFSIQEPHQTLTITAESVVEPEPAHPLQPGLTPQWEQVRDEVRRHQIPENLDAFQFVFGSPRVSLGAPFAEFAAPSFASGRPLLQGVMDLCERIFTDFEYDPRATTVTTPVDEVLRSRRGVCQDFAHLMIACVRSLGLPARYVSGYVCGAPGTVGGGASHAWVSVFCPDFGWLDIDPTNNVMRDRDHVTLAWGRDYSDVTPVKGVALGSGEQVIDVSVAVSPDMGDW